MPPKVKYTKDDVIGAALAMVEENGLVNLTARRVAGKLGSSTAPVYRYFATMDELSETVIEKTQKLLLEYTSRSYTDRVFLNMGIGVSLFACEHRQVYRALLLEGDKYNKVVMELLKVLETNLTTDQRCESLSNSERRALLYKMWTFTYGMASLICVGLNKDCSQEQITKTLENVGADVIGATLAKHDKRNKSTKG